MSMPMEASTCAARSWADCNCTRVIIADESFLKGIFSLGGWWPPQTAGLIKLPGGLIQIKGLPFPAGGQACPCRVPRRDSTERIDGFHIARPHCHSHLYTFLHGKIAKQGCQEAGDGGIARTCRAS